MSKKTKPTYKIRNRAKYNEALVNRGNLTFWISDELIDEWRHDNPDGLQGRPFFYSDLAIETLLTIRELYQLPYRTTEGFGRWIFDLMHFDLPIPDYTSLCKRAAKLGIDIVVSKKKGKVDVVLDSTGLKVHGEGEWLCLPRRLPTAAFCARTHGKSKHRTWRKYCRLDGRSHLMIDQESREIIADELTTNGVHDTKPVAEMLDKVKNPVEKFYGDGIFDTWDTYDELSKRNIDPVIPPQKNAVLARHGNCKGPKLPRDEAIRGIRKHGRRGWKKRIGYHRRSLVETTMYRMKTIFGAHLKNRLLPNQKTESRIRCKILNHFTRLGMPKYD